MCWAKQKHATCELVKRLVHHTICAFPNFLYLLILPPHASCQPCSPDGSAATLLKGGGGESWGGVACGRDEETHAIHGGRAAVRAHSAHGSGMRGNDF